MPHGGRGSSNRRADRYFTREREQREIESAMRPANPHAQGRLVAHGAGRTAPITEWNAREEVLHARVVAALGVLRCHVCGQEMSLADYDETEEARHAGCKPTPRDTSRAVYPLKAREAVAPLHAHLEVDGGTGAAIAVVGSRRIPLRRPDGAMIRMAQYAEVEYGTERFEQWSQDARKVTEAQVAFAKLCTRLGAIMDTPHARLAP